MPFHLTLGIVALFGAISNVLNMEMDVSASSYCPESKDGSQSNPACASTQSRGECNKDLAGGHKDFKCVKQPERPPPCVPADC